MSGLSDVRLALHSQELEAGQERRMAARHKAPALRSWALFWHRMHTRKTLLELTPEQLRDVGLSVEQARQEGLKPFWRG
ncbi:MULTISPECIES: DUF1127 domain-containing protein [unclassified Pseudomonas]|jgi:uncharacterized protein YjiS (DUF1127 family)|uniref:DUF1127 domain-containing protein n=1 Tax=unclassified Pseudomonas TaxID=196821 RepID=UPI001431A7BB|nr:MULTISPECIES: DUF1127 domain-containing protein [unclassified Pseudomonas]MDY0831888.1 DUF1127 domain-containing protein [Pseudomonas sp. SED1]NIL17725.1 DUF1127 domain-containing protein [Pseudomonas sp. AN3A02]